MWLLVMLGLVGNTHVCSAGLASTISSYLLTRVENELAPARLAFDRFLSAVEKVNRDFETLNKSEVDSRSLTAQEVHSFISEKENVTDLVEECNRMSETLKEADILATDFARYIYTTCINDLAPELQVILECEMRNPLLWIKCVYLEVKEVLLTINSMRAPIDSYTAAFNKLEATLKEEYNACKESSFH